MQRTRSRTAFPAWPLVAVAAIVNLFFGALHPSLGLAGWLPAIARSLIVNAALFIIPGLGWMLIEKAPARMLGMRLFSVTGISILGFFASLVVVRLSGLALSDVSVWNVLWALANVGLGLAARRSHEAPGRPSLRRWELALGALAFFAAYAYFFWGATRVVPAQEDQDLEVMATGYGLLTRFEPLMLTDRHDVYFFAHPPLLHFLVGGSFLLHGSVNELAYYDAASQRARASRNGQPFSPPSGAVRIAGDADVYRVTGIGGLDYWLLSDTTGVVKRVPVEQVELEGIYDHYRRFPHMLEARTPNVFFGAATVALLAIWGTRISRRWWMGLLAALAYATNPEVLVRTSYGGYFAIGAFASVAILLAWERWRRWPRASGAALPVLTSAFAAVADHKLVFLPATLGLSALARWWSGRLTEPWIRRVPVAAVGFALGTLLFWGWGLIIAPGSFVQDHLHNHLLDRVTHLNPLGYSGYPTAFALWLEFNAHTGYVLLPVGVLIMVADLFRRRRTTPYLPSAGVWLIYMTLTAVAFSVIDWRMTKHLMPLVVLLCLGLTPDRQAPRWRTVVPLMTWVIVVVFNVTTLVALANDFQGFKVTPAW